MRSGKDPSFNMFAVLAQQKAPAKVQQKVTQVQAAQAAPQQQGPTPIQQHRTALRNGVRNRLVQARGFQSGQLTYVKQLARTAVSENQVLNAHLTINKADIDQRINAANMNRDVRWVLQGVDYHVTFEEYDDVSDNRNPRWYSNYLGWRVGTTHVDLATNNDAEAAAQEGRDEMAVVRQ